MTASWHSLRLSYHADQDHLIATTVAPLFRSLHDEVDSLHFLRHWRQGPHLRLNFRCTSSVFRTVIEPRSSSVLGGHLTVHPSTVALEAARWAAEHEKLARDERELGPLTPWYPDNHLTAVPYDDRAHVLGARGSAILAEFYDRTNENAFAMIRAVRRGESRARLGFDLLVATAHVLSGIGIERGFVSFRSHSEAHLTTRPDGERRRSEWGHLYAARGDRLRARLRSVLRATASENDDLHHVREWLAAVRPLAERARADIDDGRLVIDADRAGADRGSPRPADAGSGYQQWLEDHRRDRILVESAPWFLAYRWVLNCTYLQLRRIGLIAADRYLLCTLLARAVEDEFGVRALDVVHDMLAEATAAATGRGGRA